MITRLLLITLTLVAITVRAEEAILPLEVTNSIVVVGTEGAMGTGFYVSHTHILTAGHVCTGRKKVTIYSRIWGESTTSVVGLVLPVGTNTGYH